MKTRYVDRGGARVLRASAEPAAATASHWTVGRLNREVKAVLAAAFPQAIWLVGEISGFNRSRHKKHVGFTLIEREATGEQAYQVQAILFDGARREIERKLAAAGNPFTLEDEIEVRVRVRVDLYDAWGAYRVEIEELDLAFTLGEAARRREEIVQKLGAEGLLEKNARLPFPDLPLRVGLITSLGSDAYHDVMRTLGESGFAFQVTAHGARVQGRATEASVLNALDWFRARQAYFDAVLICRGGGSRTDLAWFDSEALGRAVAAFPIPIVSGIGHEQDVSVLDHVARRAKTPTAAAGFLVDAVRTSWSRIEELKASIFDVARAHLDSGGANRAMARAGWPAPPPGGSRPRARCFAPRDGSWVRARGGISPPRSCARRTPPGAWHRAWRARWRCGRARRLAGAAAPSARPAARHRARVCDPARCGRPGRRYAFANALGRARHGGIESRTASAGRGRGER